MLVLVRGSKCGKYLAGTHNELLKSLVLNMRYSLCPFLAFVYRELRIRWIILQQVYTANDLTGRGKYI